MSKQTFAKGFFNRIRQLGDDIHRTAKGIEKGKIDVNVDATPELKAFVKKELDETKKQIQQELSNRIQPKHMLYGALAMGGGVGVGNAVTSAFMQGFNKGKSRHESSRQEHGQYLRPGGAPINTQY